MRWMIVALLLAATNVATAEEQLVEVTASKLNVRVSPSAEAPVINQVSEGDRLVVIPASNGWAAISREGKAVGYLSIKYLRVLEQPSEPKKPPEVLLLALLAVAVVVAVFRFRRRRLSIRNPEASRDKQETTVVSPWESQGEVPDVGRDFRSTYQTKTRDETEEREKVEDLPTAVVEWVVDGDTVVVSNTWRKTTIRLDSIDCPEDGQPWGELAKAGLIKLIGGRPVHIEEHGQDHYGRILATLYCQERHGSDWINVNEKMVAKGHAWVMRKYYDHLSKERKDRLNHLEKWARTKKVGLWKTSQPIPPWKWRNEKRGLDSTP